MTENNRRARYYKLTAAGRTSSQAPKRKNWMQYAGTVTTILTAGRDAQPSHGPPERRDPRRHSPRVSASRFAARAAGSATSKTRSSSISRSAPSSWWRAARSPDDAYREAVAPIWPLDESRARLFDAARHREQRMQRTEYLGDLRQDSASPSARWPAEGVDGRHDLHARARHRRDDGGVQRREQPDAAPGGLSLRRSGRSTFAQAAEQRQQHRHARDRSRRRRACSAPGGVDRASFEAMVGYSLGVDDAQDRERPASRRRRRVVPEFFAFAGANAVWPVDCSRSRHSQRRTRRGHLAKRSGASGLAADQGAIGKRLTLNDSLYTIVGVAPASLQLPDAGISPPVFWLPLDVRDDKGGLAVLGRLRPGATPRSAEQRARLAVRAHGRVHHRQDSVRRRRRGPGRPAQLSRFSHHADGRRRAGAAHRLRERRASA